MQNCKKIQKKTLQIPQGRILQKKYVCKELTLYWKTDKKIIQYFFYL